MHLEIVFRQYLSKCVELVPGDEPLGHQAVLADVAVRQLAAIGTAGAWRLGHWALLKTYLATTYGKLKGLGQDDVWETRLGKLLFSISSRQALQGLESLHKWCFRCASRARGAGM